jgi:hypothetical protein
MGWDGMRWYVIFKSRGYAKTYPVGSAHNTKLGCVVLIDNKNFQANNHKIFTILPQRAKF